MYFPGDNVHAVLRLAEHLEMPELTRRCELFLMAQPVTMDTIECAQRHRLEGLMRRCIDHYKLKSMLEWERIDLIGSLSDKNQIALARGRIKFLEATGRERMKLHEKAKQEVAEVIDIFHEMYSARKTLQNQSQERKLRRILLKGCDFALEKLSNLSQ